MMMVITQSPQTAGSGPIVVITDAGATGLAINAVDTSTSQALAI